MDGFTRFRIRREAKQSPLQKSRAFERSKPRKTALVLPFLLLFIGNPLLSAANGEIKYSITVLPAPGNVVAMNNTGAIVGRRVTTIGSVTALFPYIYRDGVLTELGTIDGLENAAVAINNAGQVHE
jgi:hypothetical protein